MKTSQLVQKYLDNALENNADIEQIKTLFEILFMEIGFKSFEKLLYKVFFADLPPVFLSLWRTKFSFGS